MKKILLLVFALLLLASCGGKKDTIPEGYAEYAFGELRFVLPKDTYNKVEMENFDYCLAAEDTMIAANSFTKEEVKAAGLSGEELAELVFQGHETETLNGHRYYGYTAGSEEDQFYQIYSLVESSQYYYDVLLVCEEAVKAEKEAVLLSILENLRTD